MRQTRSYERNKYDRDLRAEIARFIHDQARRAPELEPAPVRHINPRSIEAIRIATAALERLRKHGG
jgi:hypothetical protein